MSQIRESIISATSNAYNLFARRLPAGMSLPSNPYEALQTYFDAVWVLTIPRNTKRQEFMKNQLSGLTFEFFEGIDGKSLSEGDLRLDIQASHILNRREVRVNELACTMSHLVMFKAIIDKGLQRVLILEDDAVLLERRKEWIPYCLERLPSDWELFYLGYRDGELRGYAREISGGLRKASAPCRSCFSQCGTRAADRRRPRLYPCLCRDELWGEEDARRGIPRQAYCGRMAGIQCSRA